MTFKEAYTSLLNLYKKLMFPEPQQLNNGSVFQAGKWTMTEIDQLDVHFFDEMFSEDIPQEQEPEVYLSTIWG